MRALILILVSFTAVGMTVGQVPYPGNDADHGVSRVTGHLDPYTGNASFGTRDLVVEGAVGKHGLRWERHANSRTTRLKPLFGQGHNWSHNWQWELVDAGLDREGRAVLALHKPKGWVHRFTRTEENEWWPDAAARERLLVERDQVTVLLPRGEEVIFSRRVVGRNLLFRLERVVDSIGNVWTFEWKQGHLVRITEPAGRWLAIHYTTLIPPGQEGGLSYEVIASVEASDGQQVEYRYEFLGQDPVLVGAMYPGGIESQYDYKAPAEGRRTLLTRAIDPRADREVRGRSFVYRSESDAALGQIERILASSDGAVIEQLTTEVDEPRGYALRTASGAVSYRRYYPGGNAREEIDALGYASSTEYDAGGRGYKMASTDPLGHVTRFDRDADGNVLRETYADGASKSWTHDKRGRILSETNELGATRRFQLDEQGRVVAITHRDGTIETIAHNEFGEPVSRTRAGATTRFLYDEQGLRTGLINALGYQTTYEYDALGRVAAMVDPRGNRTQYERNAAGNVVRINYADGAQTWTEYDEWGQVVRQVDATAIASTFVYDEFGRCVSSFDALGAESRTEYVAIGQPGAGHIARKISPSGRVTSMDYDPNGRLIARTTAAGTSEAATTRYAYDAAGRRIAVTDPRGQTVNRNYDKRGRLKKIVTAMGRAHSFLYDAAGRRLSETDAKGNTKRWSYDLMGRVVSETDALGYATRKSYDEAGRLLALMDAKGNVHRFEYDLLGRQTALVYPDGSRESTTYDAAGSKLAYTNRAGTVQAFSYDRRNREVASEWSDGSQKIVKAYDAAGRMVVADNGVSRITFTYDAVGRLDSETQDLSSVVTDNAFDPEPRTVSYTYDADGRKVTLTYPDGSVVQYKFNARGQLEDIMADGLPASIASYEYDLAGNAIRMPRENLTETTRTYDNENRVTEITESGSRQDPLFKHDYTYDEVGNRTSTTELARPYFEPKRSAGTRETYHYDATYQVTGVDYGQSINNSYSTSSDDSKTTRNVRFKYDAVGNRIERNTDGSVTRYTVNRLNQYTQVGDIAPVYDGNGNLARLAGWLYEYDAMNRLHRASNDTTDARFFYDAKNRCIARRFNDRLQLNTYENWNLIEERDGSGLQQARYVHGRRIDEIILMVNGYGVFYPHHDGLGNVTMLTDVHGRVVERYSYSVEGKTTVNDGIGNGLEESLVGNRWMFTGREWLGQVGLYDYRNRVFSPEVGRFLQCDPIRFSAGDINIYRYCHNRYVVLTDPYGLIEWSEAVSFGGQVTFAYGVGGSIGVSVDSTGLNFSAALVVGVAADATVVGSISAASPTLAPHEGGNLFVELAGGNGPGGLITFTEDSIEAGAGLGIGAGLTGGIRWETQVTSWESLSSTISSAWDAVSSTVSGWLE